MEAHHHPARRAAGRIGGLIAFSSLFLLAVALLLCAEASAAPSVTGALGAVAQTTPQELASTTSTTVAQATKAATALPSPTPPAALVQQAAHTTANMPTSPPPAAASRGTDVGTVVRGTDVGTVVRDASQRLAPTSGVAGGAGGGALRAIVHTATAATDSLPVPAPVTAIVQRVSSSRVVGIAGAVTHAVAHATGTTQIVQTLAHDATTLTAAIPRGSRPGGAIEKPTSPPPTRPTPAPLRTIERLGGTHQPAAAQQQALTAAGGQASIAQPAAERPLVTATPLVQDDFGRWIGRAGAANAKLWPLPVAVEALRLTRALARGQSAVSSPARGAHPAPPPASPTPTPSPGGVSPAAAVGAAAGLSIVSLLAALLMLAAPLVRRRLRLDVESWRLSPFVLIADRPG